MTSRLCRAVTTCALGALFSGCTTVGETKKGAVSFNRVFADARNEILLLNILRASDGAPQQFSTASNVTGAMRPQFNVTGELANLAESFRDVFKPSGSVGFRNPQVTITPLETKEFREGMMKPIELGVVDQLLKSGWDPRVVLNLVISTPICAGDARTSDSLAQGLSSFELVGGKEAEIVATTLVSSPEATKMLREGAGKGIELELLPSAMRRDGKVQVQFKKAETPKKLALRWTNTTCGSDKIEMANLKLRSPQAMIQYLGKTINRQENGQVSNGNAYFRVVRARGSVPSTALVGTRYRDSLYFIEERGPSSQTMAVLAEIIGFQTMNATLNASKPTITVPAE